MDKLKHLLISLAKEYPNDQRLGERVRKLAADLKKGKDDKNS